MTSKPARGEKVKAWAIINTESLIAPTRESGKATLEVHWDKESAERSCVADHTERVVPCTITYQVPKKKSR